MDPTITLGENKLQFSPESLALLNAVPGNRVAINYVQISSEYTFPVIGKAEYFSDPEAGSHCPGPTLHRRDRPGDRRWRSPYSRTHRCLRSEA